MLKSYRFATLLSVALATCHFDLQCESEPTSLETVTYSSSNTIGRLDNGLSFTIIPSSTTSIGFWVKLSAAVPQDEANSAVAQMTQYALFQGTKERDGKEINSRLTNLCFNIDPDNYVRSNEIEHCLQFSITKPKINDIRDILDITHDLSSAATLTDDAVEMARLHLVQMKDKTADELFELQTVTASEVRSFYAKWYQSKKLHITVEAALEPAAAQELISTAFESAVQETIPAAESDGSSPAAEALAALASPMDVGSHVNNDTYVIDGKILVQNPSWSNVTTNGTILGAGLLALGIGVMITAGPAGLPLLLAIGLLQTAFGTYYLVSSYPRDPYYIEYARKQDLQKGCAHAFQKSRAGITLTPFERRTLFMQEMVNFHQTSTNTTPITILANVYQINDPIFSELFTIEELEDLNKVKRDFVQEGNQYKTLKNALEAELVSVMKPFALLRDSAVMHAKDIYNQNYYIMTKKSLADERDQEIKDINEAYSKKQITSAEKNEFIKDEEEIYNRAAGSTEFKTGLALAESTLDKMKLEAQADYSYQLTLNKQMISYDERLASYVEEEGNLIFHYDQELYDILIDFPMTLSSLPDYLDLRSPNFVGYSF